MDRIISEKAFLQCSPETAFELFTDNRLLENWLTTQANVVPEVGGKYELYWDPKDKENNSTIGCKILAIDAPLFLVFEWKGPRPFKHFMNHERPLTTVTVFFIPKDQGTEICLVHTGWRDSVQWESARQFFVSAWQTSLTQLMQLVNRKGKKSF